MGDVNRKKRPLIDVQRRINEPLPDTVLKMLRNLPGCTVEVEQAVAAAVGDYRTWSLIHERELVVSERINLLDRVCKDLKALTREEDSSPGSLRLLPRIDRWELTRGIFESSEWGGDPVETLSHQLEALSESCAAAAKKAREGKASPSGGGNFLEAELLTKVADAISQLEGVDATVAAHDAQGILEELLGKTIGGDDPTRVIRAHRDRMNEEYKEFRS